MKRENQPHILNAASNLIGICFVLVTAIKLSHLASQTFADEISTMAAIGFLASIVLSYLSIRSTSVENKFEGWADGIFLASLLALFTAVLIFSVDTL